MSSESVNSGSGAMKIPANLSRMVLGLVFLFSGIVKAIDPVGTQIKFTDYLSAFGLGNLLLPGTLLIFACLLAGFEILLGAYMTMGVFRRGTTLLCLIFMCVMTPFTLYVAIADPVEDCGCFGDALILTNWQTFLKNVVLLALAIMARMWYRSIVPFVRDKWQWTVTVVVLAISVRFMVDNINGLPKIDFRPYRIGTDLRSKVLEEQDPEFSDFFIFDSNMDDATAGLLNNDGYSFLLVFPHLESADESDLDLIDDLAEYCSRYGYGLTGITASGSDIIDDWVAGTAAQYDLLQCDEIPLETMVRSNPGLILMKDGVILNKWSHRNIPGESELDKPLERLPQIVSPKRNPLNTPWGVAALFLLPLLLLGLIDRINKSIL